MNNSDKIVIVPTANSVFKNRLKGVPINLTGGYKDLDDHTTCIDALDALNVVKRLTWGIFVQYPIKVTCSKTFRNIVLKIDTQITEYGLFYTDEDGLSYKKWKME